MYQYAVLEEDELLPVSELVSPLIQETVPSPRIALSLSPSKEGLDGVESTGEIKEHHSHPASQLLWVGIGPVVLLYDSIVLTFNSSPLHAQSSLKLTL